MSVGTVAADTPDKDLPIQMRTILRRGGVMCMQLQTQKQACNKTVLTLAPPYILAPTP